MRQLVAFGIALFLFGYASHSQVTLTNAPKGFDISRPGIAQGKIDIITFAGIIIAGRPADLINSNLKQFWISMGGKKDIAWQNCQTMLCIIC
ncbi:MAG: hypothetical protein JW830_13765 [Bacteroidales bacterium]|nr:hypothetical protein [Bacteroidales bacterium]